jgi:transposase-like protein
MGHDGVATPTEPGGGTFQQDEEGQPVVWRYSDMCRHWGVSRATVERWVRRYEERGEGIPVHRDPSGRPYWLAHEAAADVMGEPQPRVDSGHLQQLRRAAKRSRRRA